MCIFQICSFIAVISYSYRELYIFKKKYKKLVDKNKNLVYDATDANKIKRTSTAHPLFADNRWTSAGRYLADTSRLMNAVLRLIIAYSVDYVKSEYLHEQGF